MQARQALVSGLFGAAALFCASFFLFVSYASLAWDTAEIKVTSFETSCGGVATCHERKLRQYLGETLPPPSVEVITYTMSWIDPSGINRSREVHPKGRTDVVLGDVQLRKVSANMPSVTVGGRTIPFWLLLSLVGTVFFGSLCHAVSKDAPDRGATDGVLLAMLFFVVVFASGAVFATKSNSASYDLGFQARAVEVDANVVSVETRCLARWPEYDPHDFALRQQDWGDCAQLASVQQSLAASDPSKTLTLSPRKFIVFEYESPRGERVSMSKPVEFFGAADAPPRERQTVALHVDPHRPRLPRLATQVATMRNLYVAVASFLILCLSATLLLLVTTGRLRSSRRPKVDIKERRRDRPLFQR